MTCRVFQAGAGLFLCPRVVRSVALSPNSQMYCQNLFLWPKPLICLETTPLCLGLAVFTLNFIVFVVS